MQARKDFASERQQAAVELLSSVPGSRTKAVLDLGDLAVRDKDPKNAQVVVRDLCLFVKEKAKFPAQIANADAQHARFTPPVPADEVAVAIRTIGRLCKQYGLREKCDLRGCDLRTYDFAGGSFAFFDFDNSTLDGANLSGCYLEGTSFRNCYLEGVKFTPRRTQSKVNVGEVANANLKDAVLVSTRVEDTDFEGADTTGTDFSNAYRAYEGDRSLPVHITQAQINASKGFPSDLKKQLKLE